MDEYIVHNAERNDAIIRLAEKCRLNGPTCIIVDRTEHGLILAQALRRPFVYGGTAKREREDAWRRFRGGELDCVIVSKIGDEGLDLPNIRFLILAAGGKAQHRQIQRLGRGMRASEGKTHLIAFDFFDNLGFHLPKHARARERLYEKEPAYTITRLSLAELGCLLLAETNG